MRKIDYSILADVIALELKTYRPLAGSAASMRCDTAERIARNFANSASVNKAEFLKACGIE